MSDRSGGSSPDGEADVQMSDKASFREQSSSFQKLLTESSKYRQSIPEPGQKPKKLEGLSPRPVPGENGVDSDEALTPKLNRRKQVRPLSRANMMNSEQNQIDDQEESSPTENKSRYSQFANLPTTTTVPPSTPQAGLRQPVQRAISLPPVAGPDRRKMDDVLMFSRQGSDITTKLRRSTGNESPGSAPNSPMLSRGPLSARKGRIDLSMSSPRT